MNYTKKILIANKFYYSRGGADVYAMNLEKLLQIAGHKAAFFSQNYPQNISNFWQKYWLTEFSWKTPFRPFGDKETKTKFNKILDDFKPDVVHLNNIHSQISPIIAQISHEQGIKIVWTIHDTKMLCPNCTCISRGNICEKCFGGNKRHCTKNNCKGNILASFIFQKEAEKWNRERLEKYTDVFICPSNFMKQKMIQGGFSDSKLKVLHNFVDIPDSCKDLNPANRGSGNYYAYIGRLSREKGISTLCSVASKLPYKLKIVGSGPLEKELKIKYKNNEQIEFLGHQDKENVLQIMAGTKFTICPSECYENNPLAVIESLCLGVPVLGSNIGGIPELTDNLFESGNESDLKNKIKYMMNNEYKIDKSQMTEKFGKEKYLENLVEIYERI
jgi:glycosyltransferase involved in cell wall biosynthesis